MVGWNLKNGNASKITNSNDEYFWDRIKDFLSKKTTMKNLYKITLIRSLIYIDYSFISSKKNIFNQVVYEFSSMMWDFKSKITIINASIYNGVSNEAKQDKIIAEIKSVYKLDEKCKFEELNEIVKQKYIEKTKSVIKTNVIGAVFCDFNEEIYSFNLKNEELFFSGEYIKFFRNNKNILLQLLYYREIEFIKLAEKDCEKISQYYNNDLDINELNENYYGLINATIKNIQNRKGKAMNSKQGFRFEVPYCIKLISEIENGTERKDGLKDSTGAGENRVNTFIDWLKYINAITIENQKIALTPLGETYLKIAEVEDYIEPLMLYHLIRNSNLEKNDGHFYFSELVNDILYRLISDYSNKTSVEEIKKEMFKIGAEEKYPQFITSAITTLSDAENGFGKIGILEVIESNGKEIYFEVHSYWVEPLVAAYIIYDMWKDGQTSIGIDKIVNEKYNLGRMFLMDEEAVMETLEEIQLKKLITIETIAGLNQIRINPSISKDDILDMIIKEVCG